MEKEKRKRKGWEGREGNREESEGKIEGYGPEGRGG
jgi:hypothetical protein